MEFTGKLFCAGQVMLPEVRGKITSAVPSAHIQVRQTGFFLLPAGASIPLDQYEIKLDTGEMFRIFIDADFTAQANPIPVPFDVV